jgi:hypothetical protein
MLPVPSSAASIAVLRRPSGPRIEEPPTSLVPRRLQLSWYAAHHDPRRLLQQRARRGKEIGFTQASKP